MSYLRDVHPQDFSVEPFKVHKKFTFTHGDTANGIFGLKANSGSLFNFATGSTLSQSFGTFNALSRSLGLPMKTWYSEGTFYNHLTYYSLNHNYYERYNAKRKVRGSFTNQVQPFLTYGRSNPNENFRELHESASVISVPQQFFGEGIKPLSVRIRDDISNQTTDIRDDGHGNLYDYSYSASYAAHKASFFKTYYSASVANNFDSSSVVIGNVFYKQGIIVMTSTGSKYLNAFTGVGADGFRLEYRATRTLYQYEALVISPAGQHNQTKNVSTTFQRSGSTIISDVDPARRIPEKIFGVFGDNPSGGPQSSGSFERSYPGTQHYENFVTHSAFMPYITTIGLYNDAGECLVIGKMSRPIKNDDKMAMSFVVRFDV